MRILIAYVVTEELMAEFARRFAIQNGIPGFRLFQFAIFSDLSRRNGKFNLSTARNLCLDEAQKRCVDYVLLADADTIVLNWPTQLPEYWAHAPLYVGQPGEVHPPENALYQPGWLLLSSKCFHHRFFTGFMGYGREEDDFAHNVLKDVPQGETDLRTMHIWHEDRPWKKDCRQYHLNTHLYQRRYNECRAREYKPAEER